MRTRILLAAAALGAGVLYLSFAEPGVHAVKKEDKGQASPDAAGLVVGAGRVEPVSEEIKIGSELDAKLSSVPVEEGERVHKGQVLAVLNNGDYVARVKLAEAAVSARQAEMDRVVNGARAPERREAAATVREAEAVLENARLEKNRRTQLLERGAISRTEYDSADREVRVADARLDAVREHHAFVDDVARVEDVRKAQAEIERARAEVAEAQALLSKTYVRSPIDGVVLRKKLKSGESVSGKGDPPILTLGDCSSLRVRVDVDETDVARVAVGQRAWVTASAYGDRKFTGRVVRVGWILGRKNVRTDEPTERIDTKILETLVELDPGQTLPLGLRVDAYIQPGGKQ